MYSVNETVMYANMAVCRIVDIRTQKLKNTEKLYYVLKPLYEKNATFYCPVGGDKHRLRKPLSRGEALQLIKSMPEAETDLAYENQARKENYCQVLKNGSHCELVSLIKTLYRSRQERAKAGKRPFAAEEKVMKEAENILNTEIAYALQINPENVVDFIKSELEPET